MDTGANHAKSIQEIPLIKFLTLLTGAVIAVAPAAAQGTPPVAPRPSRVETPATPRAARAPRPLDSFEMPNDRLDLERQREAELRQQEAQERQMERQREMEARQRELQESQIERQREVEERQRERMYDLELRTPRARSVDFIPPVPAVAPTPFLGRAAEEAKIPESLDGKFLNQRPPAAWAHGDPADSLYRVAREALNRGDYRRAAQLFNELTQRFPNSNYAYVSGYYEAFSRYRIGTTEELRAADRALRALADRSAAPSNGWRDNTDV